MKNLFSLMSINSAKLMTVASEVKSAFDDNIKSGVKAIAEKTAGPTVSSEVKKAFDNHIKSNVKEIVNDMVLPIAAAILLVILIVRAAFMFVKYRQGEDVGWKLLVGCFVGLIITTTANLWMWNIIGW